MIEDYLQNGCGRCSFYATPECKVNFWRDLLIELRRIILDTGLREELKWSNPCYTLNGNNILMLSALKDSANISFFKGSLLKDQENILKKPGENSQAGRYLKFTNLEDIYKNESHINAYILEAIEIEKQGLKVEFKSIDEHEVPEELEPILENDPEYKIAFEALTPGRKRGYYLYFLGAKQAKTRISRIEKSRDRILNGKGWNER